MAEPPDLARFRYPRQTEAIVNDILASTFNEFGELAALRYQALISAAVQDLAERLPALLRHGLAKTRDGLIVYHTKHSRRRVPKAVGRVGKPRHVILAELQNDCLVILNVVPDWMLTTEAAAEQAHATARRIQRQGDEQA